LTVATSIPRRVAISLLLKFCSMRRTISHSRPVSRDSAGTAGCLEASEATRRAAEQAREAAKNAADQASNKVQDALITTSVNAELAKDPALSAAHIDVETDNGRVALRGTAPDEGARARATQLASGVEGVVSVDNQITVDAKRG